MTNSAPPTTAPSNVDFDGQSARCSVTPLAWLCTSHTCIDPAARASLLWCFATHKKHEDRARAKTSFTESLKNALRLDSGSDSGSSGNRSSSSDDSSSSHHNKKHRRKKHHRHRGISGKDKRKRRSRPRSRSSSPSSFSSPPRSRRRKRRSDGGGAPDAGTPRDAAKDSGTETVNKPELVLPRRGLRHDADICEQMSLGVFPFLSPPPPLCLLC